MVYYLCAKFYGYRPFCYLVVRGTVMTSGRNFLSFISLTGVGVCGITFEFLGWLMRPGRRKKEGHRPKGKSRSKNVLPKMPYKPRV